MAATGQRWSAGWSDDAKKWYYQDRSTGMTSWDKPPGCTLELPKKAPEVPPKPVLPPGWGASYDYDNGQYYYFQAGTNMRTWDLPGAGARAPAAGARREAAAQPAPAAQEPARAAPAAREPARAAGTRAVDLAPGRGGGSPQPILSPKGAGGRRGPSDPRGWDPRDFAARVQAARATGDRDTIKKVLAEVSEHNYLLREQWPTPRTSFVTYQQCVQFGLGASLPRNETRWTFSNTKTVEAMQHFCRQRGKVVCGLNFANGEQVGGGYKRGAMAQEEDLCRQMPTLYSSLFGAKKYGDCYPFGPCTCRSPQRPERYCDVLFTPGLVIARGPEDQGYSILEAAHQVEVCLVSAAAPNIGFKDEVFDQTLIYNAIQAILVAPKMREPRVTTLVIGAWGCGAFGGDPSVYAPLFLKALIDDGLARMYQDIHIAIPKTGSHDVNADTFYSIFVSKGVPLTAIQ